MQSSERDVVGGVAQVALRIERFFDAQPVILHQMPFLGLFRDELTFSHRQHILLIIDLVGVTSEEMEEEFSERFFVLLAKAA